MHTPKYKHIIWDWNGTLINDARQCVAIVSKMMQDRNLGTLSLARYQEEINFPVINFYRQLGFDFEAESLEDIAHEYMTAYLKIVQSCPLQAGAESTLRQLSEAGLTHSLLSAYHQKRLEEAVKYFGLSPWFIKLIGLNDYYAHSKIENGRKWIEQLQFDNNEVLFIGDMLHDFDVSQAMGIDCVLLTGGHQSRNRLAQCNVPIFDSLEECVQDLSLVRQPTTPCLKKLKNSSF